MLFVKFSWFLECIVFNLFYFFQTPSKLRWHMREESETWRTNVQQAKKFERCIFLDVVIKCLSYISHEKRKDSLETRAVLLIFSLELGMSVVAVWSIHQNSKRWRLLWGIAQWKWLWGCFSHLLLLRPWCQDLWGSSEDRYSSKRVSQMLLVSYNLLKS